MEKKFRVLVIDDEKDITDILVDYIERGPFRASAANKFSHAVMMLGNQSFDVILLDMQLDGSTGEQVIAKIRKDKRGLNFKTPVIAISAHLGPELLQRIARELKGAIVKPFETPQVFAKLCEVVGIDASQVVLEPSVKDKAAPVETSEVSSESAKK